MLRLLPRRWQRLSAREIRREEDYIFGQGQQEINRLDLQHFLFRWEFGGDYSAAIRNPLSVLDVACGTGRWARDMATRFPNASVIGFDINQDQIQHAISDAQRRGEFLPDNCAFLTGDTLKPFEFADSSFQLVMARANSAYIPIDAWPRVLGEMQRVTVPNGWMEVRDFGVVRSQSLALTAMTGIFANLAAGRGLYPGVGPYIKKFFDGVPLRERRIRTVTVRSGPRPTRGGRLFIADYLALMERVGPFIERSGLAKADQWQQLLQQARTETPRITSEVELTSAFGRR